MGTRVALIGCGYWGKNIARTLASMGNLEAIVDDDLERAAGMAEQYGGRAFELDSVLESDTIDAVAIATPAVTHYEVAKRALQAGKDVFVEKPMSLRPEHGEALNVLADESGRVLMVGHLLQYHPAFIKLKSLIADGDLGRLQYVYSTRLNFGKIRREEDVLWSFAPHDVSMLLTLAGESPSSIRTEGNFVLHGRIADVTTTHLTFPSGLAGHIFVSWLHPFKEQRLVVIGERAMAVFSDHEPPDRKLLLYRSEVHWKNGEPIAVSSDPTAVEIDKSEPLRNELSHFIDCVENRTTPVTDGREGLRVLQVLTTSSKQLMAAADEREPSGNESQGSAKASVPQSDVHPTAVVDEGVSIGDGTKVWHFSHILPGTVIGDGCSLGQNVVVGPNVNIGNGVKVQNNVSVYEGVTLEDDVFCGPSMVFTNVTTPRAFVSRREEFADTVVEKGASIGANATIVCGNSIGRYALVAAGAVITSDVPPHALMAGVPARRIGWVSREGEILNEDLTCPRSGERYSLVGGELRLASEASVTTT